MDDFQVSSQVDTFLQSADQADMRAALNFHGAADKTTPTDLDEVLITDNAAANVQKKTPWSDIKATLKTYFDTIYSTFSGAYADLTGKPTLGTAAAENVGAFATAAQGATADTALQPDDDLGTPAGGILTNCTGLPTAGLVDEAVTNAKAANMAQSTIKGRAAAAGTGGPTDLTANETSTILDGATDPFVRTSVGGSPVLSLTSNYTNSTNANVDTALSFTAAATGVWYIDAQLTVTSPAAGNKIQITAPTGATVEVHTELTSSTSFIEGRITAINTLTVITAGAISNFSLKVRGTVTTTGTGGTVAIGFASTTNTQTTTVVAGSAMLKFKK
jgi:hypothetical protein